MNINYVFFAFLQQIATNDVNGNYMVCNNDILYFKIKVIDNLKSYTQVFEMT